MYGAMLLKMEQWVAARRSGHPLLATFRCFVFGHVVVWGPCPSCGYRAG